MTDVHDPATRSRNMAAIRGADTGPELKIRRALHRAGLRYRLHVKRLPGRPDIVSAKHHAVIFVHGCFFHGHECRDFRWPKSRAEFWRQKIGSNRARDQQNEQMLWDAGWRIGVVWECASRGAGSMAPDEIASRLMHWLGSTKSRIEIPRRRNA